MNILLLNPPTFDNKAYIREGRCNQEQGVWTTLWPPISLATAASVLEQEGHKVEVLDCAAQEIHLNTLLNRIRTGGYGLILWSTATPSIKSDLALADEIRKIDSRIVTGVFGTHVTTLAKECLEATEGLDVVIRNEPEESVAALTESLFKKDPLRGIAGISYKDSDGQIIHNPARPFIRDLDSLPIPAWHLLDLKRYRLPLKGDKFLILSPVRGCPYACSFCTAQTYYGKRLRRKSVPKVMEEIEYVIDRFDIRQFFVWADTFTAGRDYVTEFCQAIRDRELAIGWTCNSRVDTVDGTLLAAMAKAGCWMISYGIESGSQKILDRVTKKITLRQCREAVRMARAAGIKVAGHFVLGLPGESEATLKETLAFALTLDIDMAQFYCAVPFPGSSLFELAKAQGWIEGKGFDEFRQDNAVMNLPGLSSSVVNDYRKKAFGRFYLRPSRFFQIWNMVRMRSMGETIRGGLRFMKWMGS
ncbi:MAG: radical SAM protein [Thermodesulfobacteriota bacterium]|nr:radical SAM protein [Thermodesulfobacteriota bacterium]